MKLVPDCLHFLWIAALLAGFVAGWGALLVRRLRLPSAFVLPVGFAVFAAGTTAVFYATLAAPWAGRLLAWAWGAAGLVVTLRAWRRPEGRAVLAARDAWTPGVLLLALAAGYLALLFAYKTSPATRFTWELPIDDQIPRLFADRLAAHESPTPLVADWTSSDRPPLQTALALTLRAWYVWPRPALNYQYTGTLLQLLWLPALFALGRTLGLRDRPLAFVLLCCAGSGFFLLNSLYVWPKLLAGALVLTALAVLLAAGGRAALAVPAHAALAAGCAALGLLAHGGAAFTLLALPAWPAAWRFLGRVRGRGAAAALLALAAVLGPWFAYQRWFDPPGNRLLKWHLAGVQDLDTRSFAETLRTQYAQLPAERWRFARYLNAHAMFALPPEIPGTDASGYVRHMQFFNHTATLDLLSCGLLGLLAATLLRRRPPVATGGLLGCALASLAVWNLLMFIPGSTVIHQGSYATTMLLLFLGAAAIASWPAWLARTLAAVHLGLFAWAWLWCTPPKSAALRPVEAVLAVAFAGVFAFLLWRLARDDGATTATATPA